MQTIDIARRMAELGQPEEALRAYALAVHNGGLTPEETLESAVYILQNGGNYEVSYTCFLNLYREGHFREETLALLTGAFYEPNVKELRGRYERNVKLLKRYPYLFRKDFPSFEDLPVQFYPYTQNTYIPFFPDRREFGEFVDMKKPIISRNFFKDLEKPVLAAEVYSQYELEYLRDNVRRSDYVGRENHVYLHYEDWGTFCSYLQCWNVRPLLEEEKLVFLIGDEISQYPIDFKERFGIDYSQYPVKPVGIREIHRMIWLSQLSTHNGIFFFGEVLDGHPNVLPNHATMFPKIEEYLEGARAALDEAQSAAELIRLHPDWPPRLLQELYTMKGRTDKDLLVARYLAGKVYTDSLDPAARIAPALLFSPHFGNIMYQLQGNWKGRTILLSEEYDKIRESSVFKSFRYIKTVTPIRRPTTSHAATVRYMVRGLQKEWENQDEACTTILYDAITSRILNRSFLIDPQDRMTQDSIAVRFEDGKLNPEATFRALAAFLDIPYTESMTYCSTLGKHDPGHDRCDVKGFDPATVYETYDEYANDCERRAIEYYLRDFYDVYGYDFHYYDGQPVDPQKAEEWIDGFTTLDGLMRESMEHVSMKSLLENTSGRWTPHEIKAEDHMAAIDIYMDKLRAHRLETTKILQMDLHFENQNGQPLSPMPLLKLDPALLEQPLYH